MQNDSGAKFPPSFTKIKQHKYFKFMPGKLYGTSKCN